MIKKILLTGSIILSSSNIVNAKTEGVSVSLSGIATIKEVPVSALATTPSGSSTIVGYNSQSNISYGIGIAKAYNFGKFYIEPEIFYDNNNLFTKTISTVNYTAGSFYGPATYQRIIELKYSYGGKINLGYDITDNFALFGILGYSENRYSLYGIRDYSKVTDGTNYLGSGPYYAQVYDTIDETAILGIGSKYSINDDIDISASLEISQFFNRINELSQVFNATTGLVVNHYKLIRLKASYKF